MSTRLIGIVIVSLLVIAGCGGHFLTLVQPIEASLEPFDGVCFSVNTGDKEDFSDEVTEIEEQVIIMLYDLALFDTTYMGRCYDTTLSILNVTAVMTGVRDLSFVQRYILTDLARNCVAADLYFVDAGTGDTVGVYYMVGKSQMQLVRGIVKLIRANCSRMGRGYSEKAS